MLKTEYQGNEGLLQRAILVSSTTTSPCTYAVESPCTGRYARWCERSALMGESLLLDLFKLLFAEIAGCGWCLHGPEAPARAVLGQRTHHPTRSVPFAVRSHSAASFPPKPEPSIPSGP